MGLMIIKIRNGIINNLTAGKSTQIINLHWRGGTPVYISSLRLDEKYLLVS